MTPVEIRQASRGVDVALVVVSRVECRIPARSRVNVLRERIGTLQITLSPATRYRCLQRVVDGVGIVRKKLVAAVAIQSGSGRAGDGIGECVVGDLIRVVAGIGNREGIRGSGIYRLDPVTRLAQM